MFGYLRNTFSRPLGDRWFSTGLIIESTLPSIGAAAFAKLARTLPQIRFDLLSKAARTDPLFENVFLVRHSWGSLRLLLQQRKQYELVVFFATGQGGLRLCRMLALLVMRPRRFFVVNEFGEGFWLHRENWGQICKHLQMRFRLPNRRETLRAKLRAVRRSLVWLAWLPVRFLLVLYAGMLFLGALSLLAILRIANDVRSCRHRFFSG